MSSWTSSELDTIAAEDELTVASVRRDGTLTRPRIVWVVRHGDDLYIRSVNGPTAAWYRFTQIRHEGHVSSGEVERDVTFVDATDLNDEIDSAYRAKYRRYARNIVDAVTTTQARRTTLKLAAGELS